MRVGIHEMRAAEAAARRTEAAIKRKYPAYRGWLALSTRYGQVNAGASIEEIFKTFPAMIIDTPRKAECQALLAAIERLEDQAERLRGPGRLKERAKIRAEVEGLRTAFSAATAELELDPAVQIEIRFKELKYDQVVWPLQQDPLIDRLRTPQTRASIRIVIGTLGDLCGMQSL